VQYGRGGRLLSSRSLLRLESIKPRSRESSPDINPCDGQCGQFIGFKLLPWIKAPATILKWSATSPHNPVWTVELLPTGPGVKTSSQEASTASTQITEQRWSVPKFFDLVRVSVSLEALKYEYTVRAAVRKARFRYPGLLCVCEHLELPEDPRQLWPVV